MKLEAEMGPLSLGFAFLCVYLHPLTALFLWDKAVTMHQALHGSVASKSYQSLEPDSRSYRGSQVPQTISVQRDSINWMT